MPTHNRKFKYNKSNVDQCIVKRFSNEISSRSGKFLIFFLVGGFIYSQISTQLKTVKICPSKQLIPSRCIPDVDVGVFVHHSIGNISLNFMIYHISNPSNPF